MSTLLDEALSAISVRRGLEERIFELEDEVARLRAERDAAREEVERLRADLLEALPSVYAEMGLTDYVKGLHRELAQLTQTLNAARAAAATWKRAAKLWRRIAMEPVSTLHARWLFRVRKERRR